MLELLFHIFQIIIAFQFQPIACEWRAEDLDERSDGGGGWGWDKKSPVCANAVDFRCASGVDEEGDVAGHFRVCENSKSGVRCL